ncbi:proline-rich receptor-like protein kinase PERK8 [Gracilaria domingensis]|nr:proline-rich receptor-like protein kinase PERK8 [Gracilaria domingensis]
MTVVTEKVDGSSIEIEVARKKSLSIARLRQHLGHKRRTLFSGWLGRLRVAVRTQTGVQGGSYGGGGGSRRSVVEDALGGGDDISVGGEEFVELVWRGLGMCGGRGEGRTRSAAVQESAKDKTACFRADVEAEYWARASVVWLGALAEKRVLGPVGKSGSGARDHA